MESHDFGNGQGAFQIYLDAVEEHTRDDRPSPALTDDPFTATDNPQDGTNAASSSKAPNQPRKARTSKQGIADASLREFKEIMIQYRLDHWRARAQIVHVKGQINLTAFWSPPWAGFEVADRGMNMFDGFDRMWFVPFDIMTPLPAEKQEIADNLQRRRLELEAAYLTKVERDKSFLTKLQHLIEEEVKETCQKLWEPNAYDPGREPARWDDVRARFQLTHLVTMIAQTRLAVGKEQLPGYYQVKVLDLRVDGKITYQCVNLPSDVSMKGMLSRMKTKFPPDSEQSQHTINVFKHKLEAGWNHGDEAQRKKAQGLLRQLHDLVLVEKPESERYSWVFKLRSNSHFYIPAGKLPDRLHTWTQLKETTYQELLQGVRAKKHPVFIRPWKIRLRRWWPEVDDLVNQAEVVFGGAGLSSLQLDIVDELLASRTQEEVQRAAKTKQALDEAKLAIMENDCPSRNNNDDEFGPF
ncbi:hypothetical protein IWW34DRAFT_396791 [Fusarium oxysporum f. sp. albedinis]|nr:hypothetical protein FOMA001_g11250 [Fusarium oxysporum f. sp. matthiolae]KAI3581159.1 hypothetical protein IWW34DRAFT_396791 [Fusarium oxysporum f. sp. albedinis]KAJ0146290.1 Uncharacterized protein HZ326_11044 [Fusarium oxysporum f. sp. albedinis]KAK2476464.1 hypothetical protein H9L39_11688 [Fusarium oxysporum f. sp. albedinis]